VQLRWKHDFSLFDGGNVLHSATAMQPRLVVFFVGFIVMLTTATARAERVVLVAGGGTEMSGVATNCRLHAPFGIDSDSRGNLYVVEMAGGERVLKIDDRGMLSVIAGTGDKGSTGDGGPAGAARFNGMHSLALGRPGELFVADTWNNRLRRIHLSDGTIAGFAGTGEKGFRGDGGPAVAAFFGGVFCVDYDPQKERLVLTDLDNRRIRSVDLNTGTVTSIAGNGEKGVPQDGAEAVRAPLVDPRAAIVDSKGNLYILERSGHALRRVDRDGKIRTVAGTGKKGFEGDGGDALKASFSGPKHLCVDREDNVVIADTDNHVIRKYLPAQNKVVLVAGCGRKGVMGIGGPPEALEMNQPHGLHVDSRGVLYIADSLNDRVLKIIP
jgi:DNA-binding beta-propeller fold protein YncE